MMKTSYIYALIAFLNPNQEKNFVPYKLLYVMKIMRKKGMIFVKVKIKLKKL